MTTIAPAPGRPGADRGPLRLGTAHVRDPEQPPPPAGEDAPAQSGQGDAGLPLGLYPQFGPAMATPRPPVPGPLPGRDDRGRALLLDRQSLHPPQPRPRRPGRAARAPAMVELSGICRAVPGATVGGATE